MELQNRFYDWRVSCRGDFLLFKHVLSELQYLYLFISTKILCVNSKHLHKISSFSQLARGLSAVQPVTLSITRRPV